MAIDVQSPDLDRPAEAPGRTARLRDERSIGDLIKQLRDETTTLIRQEIRLAKVETTENARTAAKSGVKAATGGAVAGVGGLFIVLGISLLVTYLLMIAGIKSAVALWLGPLIVGVVVAIIGYILLRRGLNALKNNSIVPERTIQTLQEDQKWVKQKLT